MLRILSKSSMNESETGAITDPAELEMTEQYLFHLVHTEAS